MKNLLPLGSIVLIDESQYMLIGYLPEKKDENNKVYDYIAIEFPIGYYKEKLYYFNKEDINALIFIGFQNRQSNDFRKLCTNIKRNLDNGMNLDIAVKLVTGNIEELGE